jgi:hypothetical protein
VSTRTRQAYVRAVVANYVRLPGTPLRASRRDRQVAAALYDRGVPLRAVWAAFVITAVRWAIRGPTQPTLDRIRTLSYFLPAVDEVLDLRPDFAYIQYLATKLRPFVSQKEAEIAAASAQRAWSENRVS